MLPLYRMVTSMAEKATMPLIQMNIVPDFVVRAGIRSQLSAYASTYAKEGPEGHEQVTKDFIEEIKDMPIAVNTQDANSQHYEVSAAFYKLCLGPYLKYSSGLWPNEDTTFEESEKAMLDLYVERAEVKDGMKIMDLGCGWGSLSLYLAGRFPNAQITSVSNSASQKMYIDSVCKERGYKNVNVITCDINEFDIAGAEFDRVMSIEMFEHMKNYPKLLAKISTWMKTGGKLFIHIFTHKDRPYHFDKGWMSETFFTGGTMPSDKLLLNFQDQFSIEDHWQVSGTHYSKTSEAWLQSLDAADRQGKARPILAEIYGKGNETKWLANWRVFFMACAELWGYDSGKEWIVSHYRFVKK